MAHADLAGAPLLVLVNKSDAPDVLTVDEARNAHTRLRAVHCHALRCAVLGCADAVCVCSCSCGAAQVKEALDVGAASGGPREWCVLACSAASGEGLQVAVEWLLAAVTRAPPRATDAALAASQAAAAAL
jgi:hypothetical protein